MSTRPVIDDLLVDAHEFLDGGVDELTDLLDELATYADRPAPAPSHELALLLGGRPAAPAPHTQRAAVRLPVRLRARRAVAGLGAAAVAGLSLTGAAAVANELPAPVQRAIAHFSEQYLPFSFPRPVGDPSAPHKATGVTSDGSIGPVGSEFGADRAGAGATLGRVTSGRVAPDRATSRRAASGVAGTGPRDHGNASGGRTAPTTGPTRGDEEADPDTGATGPNGLDTGPGRSTTAHAAAPGRVRGGDQDAPEADEPAAPRTGHAYAGSGNSGKHAKATPPGRGNAPRSGKPAPPDPGEAPGRGDVGAGPDTAKPPRSAGGAGEGSVRRSNPAKKHAGEANARDGSDADQP